MTQGERMHAEGTFTVAGFVPVTLDPAPDSPATGLPVGVVTMEKQFDGAITGRSAMIFVSAYDPERGGTYVALESFEGSVDGRAGTVNFVHSATTTGSERTDGYFAIVPSSGTGELAGIRGSGGLSASADEHTIWLDYELD